MKTLLLAFTLVIANFASAAEIEVKVSGMVCSMCAQGIKKKFLSRDEVKELDVNLDNKIVKIVTKDSQDISDGDITKIITEAGYNVASISRK